MKEKLLEIHNLSKTYSGNQVLHNVDFTVYGGEVHALVGENGAGKSTLIKMISGAEYPDSGATFYFGEKEMSSVSIAEAFNFGVTALYQDISLFPNLSVAENITIRLQKGPLVSKRQRMEQARRALDILGVDLDLSEPLESISVGKQQLVALARAVLFNSRIIILDEPTAALSSSEVQTLYRIVKNLRDRGVGIVYISHKLDEIFHLADRITVLRDGYLVDSGETERYDHDKLISLMVGRELRFLPMQSELPPSDKELLKVEELTCRPHFENISFTLHRHEILGITGLVGAGRSELAHALFGIMQPESGQVWVDGQPLLARKPNEAIKRGICYLPEDRRTQGLFYGQSMIKNITPVTLSKYLKHGLISREKELAAVREHIEKIKIRPDNPDIDVAHMSGGNQQKAMLSRWLDAEPRVLIVDEPTSGVDIGAKQEIHRLLRRLCDNGIGVILISSDLPEVLALADRILVMRQGKIACGYSAKGATQEEILEKAIMG